MSKKNPKTFEEQFKRLEEIVDALDSSEIPLEEQLSHFEEGMELVKTLREFLNKAELKVIDITKKEVPENYA